MPIVAERLLGCVHGLVAQRGLGVRVEDLDSDATLDELNVFAQTEGQLSRLLDGLSPPQFRTFAAVFHDKLNGEVNFDTTIEQVTSAHVAAALLATARPFRE
jgi:hypothetical protein